MKRNCVLTKSPARFQPKKAKICVPLIGKNLDELQWELRLLEDYSPQLRPDLVQWNAENFIEEKGPNQAISTLRYLRSNLMEATLIFSYDRAKASRQVSDAEYCRVFLSVIKENLVDCVDIDYPLNPIALNCLIGAARKQGIRVMLSYRRGEGPYTAEGLTAIQREMEERGADLTKLALGSVSQLELGQIIRASYQIQRRRGHKPSVVLSTSDLGEIGLCAYQLISSDIMYRYLWLPVLEDRRGSFLLKLVELFDKSLGLDSSREASRIFVLGKSGFYLRGVTEKLSAALGFGSARFSGSLAPELERIIGEGNLVLEIDERLLTEERAEKLGRLKKYGLVIRLEDRGTAALPVKAGERRGGEAVDLIVNTFGATVELTVKNILRYLDENI